MSKPPKDLGSTPVSAKSSMTRRNFLGALVTVSVAPLLAADLSVMPSHFKKISQIDFKTTNQVMGGTRLIQTHDGGYFFCYQCMSDLGFYKFSANGKQEWSQILPFRPHPVFAFQARNGSFFILGQMSTHELAIAVWGVPPDTPYKETSYYPYLFHMDAAGLALPFRVNATLKASRGSTLSKMLEVDDGFLFFGTKAALLTEIAGKPLGEWRNIDAPWVFKVDTAGEIVWEFTFTTDMNTYVNVDPLSTVYMQPVLDDENNIVLTMFLYDVLMADGIYAPGATRDNHSRLIILKLNPQGQEVARQTFPNDSAAFLAPMKTGYYLCLSGSLVTLDRDLVKRSEIEMRNQANFSPYSGLPSAREGTYILFGDDRPSGSDRANAALACMDEKGHIFNLTPLGRGNVYGDMARGSSAHEVAILYLPASGIGFFADVASSGIALARYKTPF